VQTKYVFVTGGVVSGLGKGITVASLGRLLKARNYKVITQKFDPYLNSYPGHLDPLEHGEVFITDDGTETDLDLGHYERFTDESLTANSSMTMGKIYTAVLNKEQNNSYYGATVQVIPHITNEIKDRICQANNADFVITEVGGTVGDIESLPILEAIRQIAHDVGRENVVFVHIALVPYLDYIGEMKTKPAQHSVKELSSLGIQPDIIVCRTDRPIPKEMREKLALFCNVEPRCVIQNTNAQSIYEVPLLLEEERFADTICDKLKLKLIKPDLEVWQALVDRYKAPKGQVTIGLVGQYVELRDAYLSVVESLNHAGIHHGLQVNIQWISDEDVAKDASILKKLDGIVLAGSVDETCSSGKLKTVEYAQNEQIPFLGIGTGMHSTMTALAKQAGMEKDVTLHIKEKGRRGAVSFRLVEGSKTHQAYGEEVIEERFRNHCEISAAFGEALIDKGWIISEKTAAVELADHPWFVCVQFHPEYKSRLTKPSPLFVDFLGAIQ